MELGDFWLDDTSLGCLPNVALRFFDLSPISKNLPLHWGLANSNVIHQGTPPHSKDPVEKFCEVKNFIFVK